MLPSNCYGWGEVEWVEAYFGLVGVVRHFLCVGRRVNGGIFSVGGSVGTFLWVSGVYFGRELELIVMVTLLV